MIRAYDFREKGCNRMKTRLRNAILASWETLRRGWHKFSRNRLSVVGLFAVLLVAFLAIFAPYVAPHPEHAGRYVCFADKHQPGVGVSLSGDGIRAALAQPAAHACADLCRERRQGAGLVSRAHRRGGWGRRGHRWKRLTLGGQEVPAEERLDLDQLPGGTGELLGFVSHAPHCTPAKQTRQR